MWQYRRWLNFVTWQPSIGMNQTLPLPPSQDGDHDRRHAVASLTLTQPHLRESGKASWKRGTLEQDFDRCGKGRHSRERTQQDRGAEMWQNMAWVEGRDEAESVWGLGYRPRIWMLSCGLWRASKALGEE